MKEQKTLRLFYNGTLLFFLLGTALGCHPQVLGGGISVRYTGVGFALTGYLGIVVVAIISSRMTRKLIDERKAENAQLMEAALYAPAITKYARPDSLVTTQWTTDYKTILRIFTAVTLFSPPYVFAAVVLGLFFVMIFTALLSTYNWAVILGAFVLGVLLTYQGGHRRMIRLIRPLFQSETVMHSMALIVDPDGIREIIGSMEKSYGWSDVESVGCVRGNVTITRNRAMRIVPHFAFRSRADSIALAALANALKKGLPQPEYDWSAYAANDAIEDGVWPPPPSP